MLIFKPLPAYVFWNKVFFFSQVLDSKKVGRFVVGNKVALFHLLVLGFFEKRFSSGVNGGLFLLPSLRSESG